MSPAPALHQMAAPEQTLAGHAHHPATPPKHPLHSAGLRDRWGDREDSRVTLLRNEQQRSLKSLSLVGQGSLQIRDLPFGGITRSLQPPHVVDGKDEPSLMEIGIGQSTLQVVECLLEDGRCDVKGVEGRNVSGH